MLQTFNEYEHFIEAVGHADAKFTLPRLEIPFWSICQREVGKIHLQASAEGSSNIAEASTLGSGYLLFAQRIGAACYANGVPLRDDMLLASGPKGEFVIASEGAHEWYSIFVPTALMTMPGMPEEDLLIGQGTSRVLRPNQQALQKLHSIVDRLQQVDRNTPESFLEPASVASAERELVRTIRGFLGPPQSSSTAAGAIEAMARSAGLRGRPALERDRVIKKVLDRIDQNPAELPTVEQLASTLDVSERTLRTMFVEFFGMSPTKYLHVRGLNRVRQTLLLPGAGDVTIARVAARFGFWDFGRFARQYRQLFGELPSATLRKSGRFRKLP